MPNFSAPRQRIELFHVPPEPPLERSSPKKSAAPPRSNPRNLAPTQVCKTVSDTVASPETSPRPAWNPRVERWPRATARERNTHLSETAQRGRERKREREREGTSRLRPPWNERGEKQGVDVGARGGEEIERGSNDGALSGLRWIGLGPFRAWVPGFR